LKPAITKALQVLLEPIRKDFEASKEWQEVRSRAHSDNSHLTCDRSKNKHTHRLHHQRRNKRLRRIKEHSIPAQRSRRLLVMQPKLARAQPRRLQTSTSKINRSESEAALYLRFVYRPFFNLSCHFLAPADGSVVVDGTDLTGALDLRLMLVGSV